MRFPRMSTRRWLQVILLTGMLTWCGLLTWRWSHYHRLAAHYRAAAARAGELEQFIQSQLRDDEDFADGVENELRDYLAEDPGPSRLGDLLVSTAEGTAKATRASVAETRKRLEEATALRRRPEQLARQYEEAARRPWAGVNSTE